MHSPLNVKFEEQELNFNRRSMFFLFPVPRSERFCATQLIYSFGLQRQFPLT